MKRVPLPVALESRGQPGLRRGHRAVRKRLAPALVPHREVPGIGLGVRVRPVGSAVVVEHGRRVRLGPQHEDPVLNLHPPAVFLPDLLQAHGRIEAPGSQKVAIRREPRGGAPVGHPRLSSRSAAGGLSAPGGYRASTGIVGEIRRKAKAAPPTGTARDAYMETLSRFTYETMKHLRNHETRVHRRRGHPRSSFRRRPSRVVIPAKAGIQGFDCLPLKTGGSRTAPTISPPHPRH